MQTWEYLHVWANVAGNRWRPHEVDGVELPDWRAGPAIAEYLNRVGAEGWELVGFAAEVRGGAGTTSLHLVLKRPRAGAESAAG